VKKAVAWLAATVVVFGLGYLGDNMARGYVENRAADAVAAAVGTQEWVGVGLGGLPFSVALLTRSVPESTVGIASFKTHIDGHQVTLSHLSARTATVQLGGDAVTATGIAGTTQLSYADCGELAGMPISSAADGRIKIAYSLDLFGRSLTATVTALPVLDAEAQAILLTEPELNLDGLGGLSVTLGKELMGQLVKPLKFRLPTQFRLTSFVADNETVLVGFAADSLTLSLR